MTMSSRGHIGGEPFEYVLYAEPDEPRLQSLRAAMTLAVDVLACTCPRRGCSIWTSTIAVPRGGGA